MRVRNLLVAVAMLALAGTSCFGRVLDEGSLEETITAQVREALGEPDVTVDCPAEVTIEQGGVFTCTAASPDGATTTVEVTQQDDQGRVEWRFVDAAPGDEDGPQAGEQSDEG